MWFLRRLFSMGCPQNELIEVLKQQIVSVCEVGVPFWAPMITVSESNMVERSLKTGLHIILQEKYVSFGNALKIAKMQSLHISSSVPYRPHLQDQLFVPWSLLILDQHIWNGLSSTQNFGCFQLLSTCFCMDQNYIQHYF